MKVKFKGERTASTIKIVIGLLLFLACIFTDFIIGSSIIIALLSSAAAFEFLKAFDAKNKLLMAITIIVSAAISLYLGLITSKEVDLLSLPFFLVLLSFYAIILLCVAVAFNKNIKYVHALAALFASVAIPFALSCFLLLNNIGYFVEGYSHFEGIYFVCMGFALSWLTDVFAFLVGRKLGKHKLCPNISPKKSVEGAIGGVVISVLLSLFVTFVFEMVSKKLGYSSFIFDGNLKFVIIAAAAVILSVASMFGDLAASVLKRNAGIKDFSNILPGHGGIMDRFDSCLFVLPLMFGLVIIFNKAI